jgi:outer membrane protein insertion porin family
VPFVAEEVRAAAAALRTYYLDQGFLDVVVTGPVIAFREERTRADVTVTVAEGPRHLVREATFSGDLVPGTADGLRRLGREVAGTPFTGLVELTVRGRVAELYGDLGYPDAVVQVRRAAGTAPGDVLLRTEISSGPRVRVAAVAVTGNRRTRAGFILRRVPVAAGDWYRQGKVKDAVRTLYATGLFSRVDVRLEGEAGAAERTLGVAVEELPARELSLSLGWSSYELLRGGAGVRHRNLFGTGRSVGLAGNLSTKRTAVTADLTDPRFLGTAVAATLPVSYRRDEEPAFTKRQVEIAPQLSWTVTRTLAATVRYPLRYAWTGSYSEEAPPELADENYRLASLALQLRHDTRRGLFFPTQGMEATLAGEAADPALGSQLSFVRLVGTVRGFLPLTGSTVLALRAESGVVVPTRGEGDIPLGERFFLGGERSVRSFHEAGLGPRDAAGEPVGGLGYNLASVELRQRIAGNLSGALFADLGNIAPNRSFPGLVAAGAAGTLGDRDVIDATRRDFLRDFRAAVGVGARYLTPVGPARLDLAWNPDPRAGEEGFVAQLSVGMAF